LDLQLQDIIQQIVFSQMENLRAFDCENCAVLVLDKSSGKVLSYIGNEYYFDSTTAGNIDFVQVPRSTGSILKPFIYACGMEFNGYNESTLLTDVGLHFGDGKNPYITRNYDNEFIGPVLYKTALANSRNIPTVQVLRDVGLNRVHDVLYNLGIVSGTATADYYGLGMALGNVYTDLYHLCQGYLSLANRGRKCSISFLFNDSLHDSYNIFSPDIAEHIQYMLSDPQARLPSFPRNGFLEYRYPVAIKTGTSRGFRDAWTIGWSDTYMVGVWLGKHNNTPTKRLSGYGAAAPFVKAIFSELHPDRDDGLNNVSFNPPQGYKPYMISTLSGALAPPNFPYATRGWFKPGSSPEVNDMPYKILPIDIRNGLLASPLCSKKFVKYKRFISLPPLFKDWALREGLPVAPATYSQLCGTWTEPVNYKLTITNPLPDAQLYVDPEMPPGHSSILLNCLVKPEVESVIWIIDGVEAGVSKYPYRHKWIIEPGIHTFQVQIPYTQFRSSVVKVKVR
jgi:penicillin-binding protein 1C